MRIEGQDDQTLARHLGELPHPADNGQPPHDLLAGLRNGAWLDAQNFPPLTYHVPGIVPEGSTLLVGPPKIGKSWFVLAVALAAAAGGRTLGHLHTDQRPVLYLALEDGHRRLQDRCRTLLRRGPIPAGFHYITDIRPGTAVATIAAWLNVTSDSCDTPPLVIVDTLGKVMPPALMGESAYQRDYRIGGLVKRLADDHPGAAVLVNHHDRKANAEDFVDSVSGTHGLAGAADTIIVLSRRRHEDTGLLKVTGRDVAEGEYALSFAAPGSWHLDGSTLTEAAAKAEYNRTTAGLGDRAAEVIAYVAEHPEGVTPQQVDDALGMDEARQYLGRAFKAGRLQRPRRGLYTPVTTVTMSQPEVL